MQGCKQTFAAARYTNLQRATRFLESSTVVHLRHLKHSSVLVLSRFWKWVMDYIKNIPSKNCRKHLKLTNFWEVNESFMAFSGCLLSMAVVRVAVNHWRCDVPALVLLDMVSRRGRPYLLPRHNQCERVPCKVSLHEMSTHDSVDVLISRVITIRSTRVLIIPPISQYIHART